MKLMTEKNIEKIPFWMMVRDIIKWQHDNGLQPCFAKLKKKFIVATVLLIGFLGIAQTPPKVSVKVDTTKIRIGEQIHYQISVENAGTGVIFPKLRLDSLQKVEIVEANAIDTLKDRLVKKYKLTSFDSGSYLIPKQAIYIWNQPYYTDSIKIDVATVAVDTLKQKMYPIKAIQSEPYTFDDFKSYFWWILGALLIIGIILYFVLRKKKTAEEIIAGIPPYQLAVSRLKALDEKQLWQKNKIKQYYIELTDIIRTYIEKELKIPALESTTDELLETITDFNTSSSLNLPEETIQKLQKLLKESDLVKFAKYKPLINEIELHRNDAGAIIDEIKTTKPPEEDTAQITNQEETIAEISDDVVPAKQKVIKKKWSTKRIIISSIIIIVLAGMATVGYYAFKGYKYAKENIIGESTKELVNTKWIKSTYGYPPVTLETPKVLKSKKGKVPEQYKNAIKQTSVFTYGSLLSNFSIAVTSTEYTDLITSFNLETSVEGALQNIKASGVNLTSVNKEPFYIGNVEAMKVVVAYTFTNPITKKEERAIGNMVITGGKSGYISVVVAHKSDDENGKRIAERIMNSIELDDETLE